MLFRKYEIFKDALRHSPIVFALVALSICFVLTGFHAFFPVTSAYDEHSHLSYVQYAFLWKIPHEGDALNSWAMSAFSCYQHQFYGNMTAIPCGEVGLPGQYPAGGNTAAFWPPIYYFLVGILMRIPLLIVSDPLIAARIATAFIWSIGVTWMAYIVFLRSRRLSLAFTLLFVAVSIPAFTLYSSFVSPHSMNPLLVAAGVVLSEKLISQFHAISTGTTSKSWFRNSAIWRNKWLFFWLAYSALCALTIPQSLGILVILGLYVVFRCWQITRSRIGIFRKLLASAALLCLSWFPFILTTLIWRRIHELRTLDVPALASPQEMPPSDPYNFFSSLTTQFWASWPGSMQTEFPAGGFANLLQNSWFFLFVALVICAVVFWKKNNWLSVLMISLIICAPIISLVFDFLFTFTVPKRYSLGLALIGLLSVSTNQIKGIPSRVILFLALMSYLLSFLLDPLKVEVTRCAGSGSELLCRLFGG